ncbi:MAG: GNAT family N-acetyltransferase [Pseudomonadota bacterium]
MIKEASFDDLETLAALARQTYSDAFAAEVDPVQLADHLSTNMSNEQFAEMMQTDVFYFYYQDEQPIGFVQLGDVNDYYQKFVSDINPAGTEIRRAYVLANVQSKGIGSALLEQAFRHPRVASSPVVYLNVWETNYGAQKLYKRYGFQKIGEMPEYGLDGELNGCEHIMARPNHAS